MTRKIPLFKIYWDEEDVRSVTDVVRRGSYWATGQEVREFEERISEYVGTKYAVTFNSGTSALHALLLACDIKQGDEVIVPSFTFIATANAPLFVGAKPVFADIEDRTYGLDPEDVEKRITAKTKAILPIHYGGCPCSIRELREIAEDYNLLLIEDAAESLGAKIKDKKVGTFGEFAMFSFCQNKVITTGEGGAIITDSKESYEKLKLIRSHGRLETQDYFSSTEYMDYVTLGYNLRMSTMTAALGLSQLMKVDKIIKMRQDKAKYMTKKLSKNKEITLPIAPPDYFHVYQMYLVRISENLRDDLMKYLSGEGIATNVYFRPVHLTQFYRTNFGYKGGELHITEEVSNQVLSLPMYPTLTEWEIDHIIEKIDCFLEEKR